MSRRDAITMDAGEIEAFLDEQRTVVLGTIGVDGRPHLVGMWFVVLDGTIHMWTYEASQKTRNLERDPRATLLAEAGDTYDTLRGVMLTADVELIRDADRVVEIGLAIGGRYAGGLPSDEDDLAAMRAGIRRQARKRVGLALTVHSAATWDHRKLDGGY